METAVDAGEPAPAGFWIRVLAVLIDWFVFVVTDVLLGAAARVGWGSRLAESVVSRETRGVVLLLFGVAYYVVLHARFGQTCGKAAVGIEVVRADGGPLSARTSMVRCLGYLLSGAPLLMGYALAGFRRDRRALHDLVAGTQVIHVRLAAPAWDPGSAPL